MSTGAPTPPAPRPPTPGWVKAFFAVAALLLVILAVLHLLGLGFGPHMHGA